MLFYIQVLPQNLLKKYLTYSKLYVFPKLGELDAKKLETVYANLRRESMVGFQFLIFTVLLGYRLSQILCYNLLTC